MSRQWPSTGGSLWYCGCIWYCGGFQYCCHGDWCRELLFCGVWCSLNRISCAVISWTVEILLGISQWSVKEGSCPSDDACSWTNPGTRPVVPSRGLCSTVCSFSRILAWHSYIYTGILETYIISTTACLVFQEQLESKNWDMILKGDFCPTRWVALYSYWERTWHLKKEETKTKQQGRMGGKMP